MPNKKAIYSGFTIEFINQLNTIKTSFLMAFCIHRILDDYLIQNRLIEKSFQRNDDIISFQALVEKYQTEKEIFMPSYLGFCLRALLINLYEAFKDDAIRYEKSKRKDWFIFLWNLRTSFAHGIDGVWRINEKISYTRLCDNQKVTIDPKWDGNKSDLDQIGGIITILDLLNFIEIESKNMQQ